MDLLPFECPIDAPANNQEAIHKFLEKYRQNIVYQLSKTHINIKTLKEIQNKIPQDYLKSFPIYTIDRTRQGKMEKTTKIPQPTGVDPSKPFLVGYYCKNTGIDGKPFLFELLGYCGKYKPGLQVKDLVSDLEIAKQQAEMMEEIQPTMDLQQVELPFQIPDFFVFKGRPEFPEVMKATLLWKDMDRFWKWLKEYNTQNAEIKPCPTPESSATVDVLFYIILMVAFDKPKQLNYLLQIYGSYLKIHLRNYIPDAKQRILFGRQLGMVIAGPEEVEQKLLAAVSIEAGRLRDAREFWEPNVPARLTKIMYWIDQWFPSK